MLRRLAVLAVALTAAGLLIAPFLLALPPADATQLRAAGLVLLTLGFWAMVVLPEFMTALIFFLIAMVLHIAPPAAVFTGFSSTAWWLVFGGMIVSTILSVFFVPVFFVVFQRLKEWWAPLPIVAPHAT